MVVEQEPLCPGCQSDEEADAQISRLKADLDRVALELKADLRKQDGQDLGQDATPSGRDASGNEGSRP